MGFVKAQLNKIVQRLKQLDEKVETFLPVSTFTICWYFIVIIELVVDYFLTIFFICFQREEDSFQEKNIGLPLLLVIMSVDMLVSLNTSYINNGRIIIGKSQIRKKYLTSKYFLLDAVVVLAIIIEINLSSYSVLISLISNFDNLISKYVFKSPNLKLAYYIFKHMVLLIMVCHFIGSFFFYLDVHLIQLGWYSRDQLWVYSSYAYNGIINLTKTQQYAYSFSYAVVTLSGVAYGDLTPLNPTQTAYTLMSLLIPLTFYTYILSVVHEEISQRRAKSLQAIKFKVIAQQYFEESGIEQTSIGRFINYLAHASEKKADLDNTFLEDAAPSIKKQYIRSVIVDSYDFSIFHTLLRPRIKMSQIENVVHSLAQEQAYPSRQPINSQKTPNIKLYFLVMGKVSEYVIFKQRKNNKFIGTKSFFNQHCFYTGVLYQNQNHFFETYEFTICHTLALDKFLQKIRNSGIFQSYHQLRKEIIFSNHIEHIQTTCFFCEEKTHSIDSCPKLRPKVDINELLVRENKRNRKYVRQIMDSKKQINLVQPINIFSDFLKQFKKEQETVSCQTQQKLQTPIVMNLKMMDSIKNWVHFDNKYSI